MLLGYRIKKRSMIAYDKVIVPELRGYRPASKAGTPAVQPVKRPLKNALRAAACVVLAFTLIGLVVSGNIAGTKNSFTLVAYAASGTGSSAENGYKLATQNVDLSTGVSVRKDSAVALPVMKIYLAQDTDGMFYAGGTDDFSVFEGADIVEDTIRIDYSSGFQFSGGTIDSVTMTSQRGKFIAYDFSAVNAIQQKYARTTKNGVTVTSDALYSDVDKEFLASHVKYGETVTFPAAGYTAYWNYTINENEKTSDTLTITVTYSNGATQASVVSISEDDYGNIFAMMS